MFGLPPPPPASLLTISGLLGPQRGSAGVASLASSVSIESQSLGIHSGQQGPQAAPVTSIFLLFWRFRKQLKTWWIPGRISNKSADSRDHVALGSKAILTSQPHLCTVWWNKEINHASPPIEPAAGLFWTFPKYPKATDLLSCQPPYGPQGLHAYAKNQASQKSVKFQGNPGTD